MPANLGLKTKQGPARTPRYGSDNPRLALSVRLDRTVHDKLVRSAELNQRSLAGEIEYRLVQQFQ